MRIRPASPEDAGKIAEVHLATWSSAYEGINSQEYLDSLLIEPREKRWDEILRKNNEYGKTLVAEIGVGIAGFGSVGPNRIRTSGTGGEIYALYLHPAFQKRGIGAALLRNGMDELRKTGFSSAVVWVLKDNPSRSLYARMGGREAALS